MASGAERVATKTIYLRKRLGQEHSDGRIDVSAALHKCGLCHMGGNKELLRLRMSMSHKNRRTK